MRLGAAVFMLLNHQPELDSWLPSEHGIIFWSRSSLCTSLFFEYATGTIIYNFSYLLGHLVDWFRYLPYNKASPVYIRRVFIYVISPLRAFILLAYLSELFYCIRTWVNTLTPNTLNAYWIHLCFICLTDTNRKGIVAWQLPCWITAL